MAKFNTRARALDMLGRQQIAGGATAISELFKNAHDAYADAVEVDYFPKNGLFIIRDDGIGMTNIEFEQRWLTLGTESKLSHGNGLSTMRIDSNKPLRNVMGEKGIGRLAIALIGSQVLVLTRAKFSEKDRGDLIAAFIHWGIFECPGINLDQIEIPIKIIPGGRLPNRDELLELIDEFRSNLKSLANLISQETVESIERDLKKFYFDPQQIEDFLKTKIETISDLSSPILSGNGHGTHFYIMPTNDDLISDIDIAQKIVDGTKVETESKILKLLLGFCNTMLPEELPPSIHTSFRVWRNENSYSDLLAENQFFTKDDFLMADHNINGTFDEFGNFNGIIQIYQGEPQTYSLPWKGGTALTECGPFAFHLAYIPGQQSASHIPAEDYHRINLKLDSLGGIYIYRDGIRILPYGDNEIDFLHIEKRRNKGAGYYFFSYRRMIGVIKISKNENSQLVEKAGREGFQENKAYREFISILENFLIQVAVDYFRENNDFTRRREELRRLQKAKDIGEKERKEKRKAFSNSLNLFFTNTTQNNLNKVKESLLKDLSEKIKKISEQMYLDPEETKSAFTLAEIDARAKVNEFRRNWQIEIPAGVGIEADLERDWIDYGNRFEEIEKTFLQPLENQISYTVFCAYEQVNLIIDRKKRITGLLDFIINRSILTVDNEQKHVQEEMQNLRKEIEDITNKISGDFFKVIHLSRQKIQLVELENITDDEIENLLIQIEKEVTESENNTVVAIKNITNQLEQVTLLKDKEGFFIGQAEINAALETELLNLRRQFDSNLELAQLGMAIEVINHEFNQNVKSIRKGIQSLKIWADTNPRLLPHYRELRTNFEHLDAYLSLLTPLSRRLYRQEVEITGADIEEFLSNLFIDRLEQNKVKVIPTKEFLEKKFYGYPSTFYPVFVNLMDNAIFWLNDRKDKSSEIYLEMKEDSLIFSDNGPGILERDREAVFEYGFTKKPGGRGLGLYISRRVLEKDGYSLELIKAEKGRGATFRIFKFEQNADGKE